MKSNTAGVALKGLHDVGRFYNAVCSSAERTPGKKALYHLLRFWKWSKGNVPAFRLECLALRMIDGYRRDFEEGVWLTTQ